MSGRSGENEIFEVLGLEGGGCFWFFQMGGD